MKLLFLQGWHSVPGGVKPTYLKDHGHKVINPALDDDDFDAAIRAAQAAHDQRQPDVIVGSSRGGAVAMNIDSKDTPLVLLCPAWKNWGTCKKLKPNSLILHSCNDEVIPFADSEELVANSGLSPETLIEVGSDHRLADGLFGRRRSRTMLEHRVRHPGQSGCIDDPLLHFTEQIDAGGLDGHSETANLTSIFACAGAVSHQLAAHDGVPAAELLSTDQRLEQVPRPTTEWKLRQPSKSFRSRIVLFESQNPGPKPACPEAIRRTWLDSGCIVTGYPDGRARVSLPP
jgi:hypothetical protein